MYKVYILCIFYTIYIMNVIQIFIHNIYIDSVYALYITAILVKQLTKWYVLITIPTPTPHPQKKKQKDIVVLQLSLVPLIYPLNFIQKFTLDKAILHHFHTRLIESLTLIQVILINNRRGAFLLKILSRGVWIDNNTMCISSICQVYVETPGLGVSNDRI